MVPLGFRLQVREKSFRILRKPNLDGNTQVFYSMGHQTRRDFAEDFIPVIYEESSALKGKCV